MLRALAQAERAPVEREPALRAGRGDEQLHQVRQHGPGAGAAVLGEVRNVPPAQDRQALQRRETLHRGHRRRPVVSAGRQEHHPGRVVPGLGQGESAFRAEHLVGYLGQDPGSVAGVRVAALGAPVIQVPQDGQCLRHDLVAPAAWEVSNEADAAGVVLKAAVVESLASRRSS